MGDGEKRKAFLKGYEEGLKAAWRGIGSLTTPGYSSPEMRGVQRALKVGGRRGERNGRRRTECPRRHRHRHFRLRLGWRERGGRPRGPRVHDLTERVCVDHAVPSESEREDHTERLVPPDLRESGGHEGARISAPREGSRGRNLAH